MRPKDNAKIIKAIFFDASGTIFMPVASTSSCIYPDAVKILSVLAGRNKSGDYIKTGIITNWDQKVKRILKEQKLEQCFDIIVSSDDVYMGKPAQEPFLLAAERACVDVTHCLHIGDSLYDDALAAIHSGFKCIWINRNSNSGRNMSLEQEELFRNSGSFKCDNLEKALVILKENFGVCG